VLPSWSRGLVLRTSFLAVVLAALVGGAWIVNDILGQNTETPLSDQGAGSIKSQPAADEAPKPDTSAGQLPTVAKAQDEKVEPTKVGNQSQESKTTKFISLQEAISIVQNAGRGEVVKGEKVGEGAETHFDLEVVDKKGLRNHLKVSGNGRVIVEKSSPTGGSAGTTTEKNGKGKKGLSREGSEREREKERERSKKKSNPETPAEQPQPNNPAVEPGNSSAPQGGNAPRKSKERRPETDDNSK